MRNKKCEFCGNDNPLTYYRVGKHYVCRQCIQYQRDAYLFKDNDSIIDVSEVEYQFALSDKQRVCAMQLTQNYLLHKDSLLYCVTGAGKTEIVYDVISTVLANYGHVGYLIPRRQVVIEVAQRFQSVFKKATVACVCQGFSNVLWGDIVVATTHQAIRYPNAFDLVILDECDAFPYKDNRVLEAIVMRCIKGNIIYSTATASDDLLALVENNQLALVELNSRYTNQPMVVPQCKYGNTVFLYLKLIEFIHNASRQILLFVPTKQLARQLYTIFKYWLPCAMITSDSDNKEETIQRFKDKKVKLLISTSILERGVTFINIDVVVLFANHPVFDKASLIQIAGRVGRHKIYYQGRCLFLANRKAESIKGCVERIEYANQSLSVV